MQHPLRWRLTPLALPLLLSLGLSACVVTPARVAYTPPAVVITAPVRPPPPRVEIIPVAPSHEYFWVYGHWAWDGRAHVWEDGHWERHREHAHWVPHRWEQDEYGAWRLREGYWRAD